MKQLFPSGRPVAGKMLIGRAGILDELENVINIGQSIILVAPRRYGKTSIVLALLERSKKKGCFIGDVDMFEITGRKALAEKIVETCLKNNPVPLERYWDGLKKGALNVLSMLKFKPSDEDVEMVLQLGQPLINEDRLLDNALDFPERFCARHNKQMVMFLDEFQDVLKIGGEPLLKKMRAKMQRHKNVVYVFAGSQESMMTELFQHKQHAFYRFGRVSTVGAIDEKDFSPYIERAFEAEGIKIGKGALGAIMSAASGHPYYTQLLCQMIYIERLKSKTDVVDISDVKLAGDAVVDHDAAFFDEVWKELGDKKYARGVIRSIAEGVSPYSTGEIGKETIARLLTELIRCGYLSKSGAAKKIKYELRDPFFKKYILEK